jgi:hypothetical protein
MKQLVQNFKTGKLEVLDIPEPKGFAEYNFDRKQGERNTIRNREKPCRTCAEFLLGKIKC